MLIKENFKHPKKQSIHSVIKVTGVANIVKRIPLDTCVKIIIQGKNKIRKIAVNLAGCLSVNLPLKSCGMGVGDAYNIGLN